MSTTFPLIKTERLVLRSLSIEDALNLFKVRYNEQVTKYIERKKPKDKSSVAQFIEDRINDVKNGKLIFWAIQTHQSERLIGTICLWNFNASKTIAEVGYELHPEFHNKGYMSEALSAVLDFGFLNLKLKAIEAFTHKDNRNSQLLLNKFNFRLEENRIDEEFPNNRIYIKTHG